jgi:predicted ArsR family transcriptional regulator
VSLPERRYRDLATTFAEGLERLERSVGAGAVSDAVGDVARAHGREAGARVRREVGPRPSRARLRAGLVALTRGLGYEPEPRAPARGSTPDVVLCNCPYRPIAEAHRDVTCGMNVAWAEGLAEGLGDRTIVPHFTPTPGRCCVTFATETGPSAR